MSKVTVWVGTTNGLFALDSDEKRRRWRRRGPYLSGMSVNHFAWDPKSKTVYAATHDDGVYATKNQGRSWTPLNSGLTVRKVWTVAVDPRDPDVLWAGTHYSYLFRSGDRGRSWKASAGYLEAPGKEGRWGDWGFGTIGNSLHTILIDPTDTKRMYVVSSTTGGNTGTQRSTDGGQTWEPIRKGTFESCPTMHPGDRPGGPRGHLENEHTCTHRLAFSASNPKVLWRQQHCGVYRSSNYGSSWRDVSEGLVNRHGFPLAVHPVHADTAYVVPARQGKCKKHNSCIEGQLTVNRTRSGGRSWDALTEGLPDDVHTVVLRHGMGTDALDPAGVYFGTTDGRLFGSRDEGDAWHLMAVGMPRIQGVLAATS